MAVARRGSRQTDLGTGKPSETKAERGSCPKRFSGRVQPEAPNASLAEITAQLRGSPPHDGSKALHLAFAVHHAELLEWTAHLEANGVEIEGRSDWKRGGQSDPDGNLLEIASTPGLWTGF